MRPLVNGGNLGKKLDSWKSDANPDTLLGLPSEYTTYAVCDMRTKVCTYMSYVYTDYRCVESICRLQRLSSSVQVDVEKIGKKWGQKYRLSAHGCQQHTHKLVGT